MENNVEIDEAASKGYDKRVQELLSDKIYYLMDKKMVLTCCDK